LEAVPAPLLIADVPWLLYRSYFALPKSIVDAEGQPVNALLGTVNTILSLIETPPPSGPPRAVMACMGAEQADYRVALYPPYHAHRDPMPPELAAQWQKAPRLLAGLGWEVPTSEELEADDVMFSYACVESERGGRALLLTADRDLYGAVDERVAVLELRKGSEQVEIGPEQVRERYGVEPEQVPDFIALRGDPSDGLPGAPGIGAKTAAELLRTYGSLEALLAAAHSEDGGGLRPRVISALLENEELLAAFKRIATLQRTNAQSPPDATTNFAAGAQIAEDLGMRRLATRLNSFA
jgi:5'-3' exonuclease